MKPEGAPPATILIVEDDQAIARMFEIALMTEGFQTKIAVSGYVAMALAAQHDFTLALIDLGLPDMDGKDLISKLRGWKSVPIIVVSARPDISERIAALEIGADDFVAKPFHMGELIARIKAALRRTEQESNPDGEHHLGGLQLNLARRSVRLDGMDIALTPKEFTLLSVLVQGEGRVVTQEQLIVAAWGNRLGDSTYLRIYIGQLRQKLEIDPANPKLILTEHGIGYRLGT